MSETQLQPFSSYARRCGGIFLAIVCGTLVMVAAAYAPIANRQVATGIILTGAAVNAFLVAGYLMHLINERKMIMAVLVFTAFFCALLMGLSVWAAYDIPGAMSLPLK